MKLSVRAAVDALRPMSRFFIERPRFATVVSLALVVRQIEMVTGIRMTLETESGTYVKEFVSGDEGRTKPSFSEALGIQCRVEELDVMAINDQ